MSETWEQMDEQWFDHDVIPAGDEMAPYCDCCGGEHESRYCPEILLAGEDEEG